MHDIDVTLLYSRDHYENNYTNLSSSNFVTGVLGFNNLQLGTNPILNTNAVESNGISMMGRINYRYNDRYLLTILARRDGYSAFGSGQKFGVFPSMALGWIISQENFMKNIDMIDNLKFRFSYGQTGNQAISPYSSLGSLGQVPYVFGNGSPTYIGIVNSGMANSDLGWETTLATNYGLDFAILTNGWFIGQPIGAIYDYTLDGIYQTGDVIPTKFKPGYYRIVDKSGNGTVGPEDRSIIGKTSPDFRLGLANT